MNIGHFRTLCDDTGMLQHSVFGVADRRHGYCVDDNARAVLLCLRLMPNMQDPALDLILERCCAFVEHAWNGDRKRFRNFMSFERKWLEEVGSEDSHGRTLWALGACARTAPTGAKRAWARALFDASAPETVHFASPRAWAFALLGMVEIGGGEPGCMRHAPLMLELGARLMRLLEQVEQADWVWVEEGLAYDNGRFCEALIVTGRKLRAPAMIAAGLRTLRFALDRQFTPSGVFSPVGSEGFSAVRAITHVFDQQPIEAAAMIAACRQAAQVDTTFDWQAAAKTVFAWYHGGNVLGLSLVDPEDGACRDGLHADRANENRGAESVLCYLLAACDMDALALSPPLALAGDASDRA